jgi:hypothetical protein
MFSSDGSDIGAASLGSNGVATLATSSLTAGTHSLTARYMGDAQHPGSTSASVSQVVQDVPLTTVVLQRGVGGYSGVADTYLYQPWPTTATGTSDLLYTAAQAAFPLIRFAIFQSEGGSVPDGATIRSATLSLYKQYYDTELRVNALLVPWTESTATWQSRTAGVAWTAPGASGAGTDYATTPDVVKSGNWNPGWMDLDVTSRVAQWSANANANRGWRLSVASGSALRFNASEYAADPTLRPKLTIVYESNGG